MKKLISTVLVMCLITALLAFYSSAAGSLSHAEAEELLLEGYSRMLLLYGTADNYGTARIQEEIEYENGYAAPKIKFQRNTRGEVTDTNHYYVYVTDERFKTLDDVYNYVREMFVEELAVSIVDRNPYTSYENGPFYNSFRMSDGGIVYFEKQNIDDVPQISSESGRLVYVPHADQSQSSSSLYKILGLDVNGNTATLKVVVRVPIGLIEHKEVIRSVNFVSTEKGWRISGGTFFDVFMRTGIYNNPELDTDPLYSPETGDASAVYTVGAVIALLMIAVPLTTEKRKTA